MRKMFRTVGALSLALAGFAGNAHAQATDWQSVATACTPAGAASLNAAQFNTALGFVRPPMGAANPQLVYTCNVLDSYIGTVPIWNWLRLQYMDTVGGAVSATLWQKNKLTGATALMVFLPSVAAGGVSNVQAAVPALDFAANAYYVVITVTPQANTRPQAHMVTLAE